MMELPNECREALVLTSFLTKILSSTPIWLSSNLLNNVIRHGGNRYITSRLIPTLVSNKRRRSNVAIIIVRVLFISLFLFNCLLCNHSFQTNPNKITNCLKFILSSIYNFTNYICSMRSSILIFEYRRYRRE